MVRGVGRVTSILVAVLIALPCVGAQDKSPAEIGTARMGVIVRASAPGENIRQVWAYADPKDGRHMILCGWLSFPSTSASNGYIYSSADAGATWHRTLLDDATRWVTEESCTYGYGGRAYFVDGQSDTSTGLPRHEWGRMQVFTSDDHGMSWKPAGRREFVDWTMLAALPADKNHAESLVIFGNATADKPGHWWDERPIALEATDGAKHLSTLVTPPISSQGNFSGGSVVLPDRTALFIGSVTDPKYVNDPGQHRQLNLFAYKPSDHSLDVRTIFRNEPGRVISLNASVVREVSRRFPGRLFAAWSEWSRSGSDAQLRLAASDDNGYHWSSRPILSMADYRTPAGCPTDLFTFPPDVRVAINRAGVLGVLWGVNGQSLLFSVSTDGGQTFRRGQVVVRQPRGELSLDLTPPINEWWLAGSIASRQAKSREFMRKFTDLSHLGLGVRLSKHNGIGDFALTADAKGTFHAFWAGAGSDGNYALMTRTIDVTSETGSTDQVLTNASGPTECGEDTTQLRPEEPSPIPPLEIAGQTDVSPSLNLQVDHVEYAADSHIVTTRVTLMNKSESTLHGPLSFFAVGLHSDFGTATPLNASGTKQGQPFWDSSAVIPADGLPPQASSKPIELRFKIDPFHSVPTGDAVAMQVRVFAGQPQYRK